ncbi:MAG: GNAT family N-acetyltransferase [Candidatus Aenigmatarchaeota archaeon]
MKEGKIIETFFVEKEGKKIPIIIRYPKKSDARGVWTFFNTAIKETEFLARVTPVPMKDETKWIKDAINKIKKRDMIQLFAEHDGKIVGSSSIRRRDRQRHEHIGDFGIVVLQEYTGVGIGNRLMLSTERQSSGMGLKMLQLSVYERNKIAQNLYRKMGFKVAGKIPNAAKTRKEYDNEIMMYKVLKK